ncbi:multimerin-2 isoform X1 [Amblyraja radiata]|uniref:multimerin-2 isoform X1 n=1 Tax=Amblyraja radiata TaxID=386614 RepID=UPI0014032D3F|nr:multimerin-2 isoform X1 [Amblyraja radiata]
MILQFIVVSLSLAPVWSKEIPASPDTGGKDVLSNEAGLGEGQVRMGGGGAETRVEGWGYETVRGTSQPVSSVRTTASHSSRRPTTITSARGPFRSPPVRNWCAFVKSRLSTSVISCGVERFVQRPTEPCGNGMGSCQHAVYQLALIPMYKVKQMIITALEWRCCPGHMGANCEDTVSTATSLGHAPESGQVTEEVVDPTGPAVSTGRRLHQELLQQQDQVATTAGFPRNLHHLLSKLKKRNHSRDEEEESRTELPALEDMVKTYVEGFLRQHHHSVWASFNDSLQVLSDKVFNLSHDVETDRRKHGKLSERQTELEELGTKLKLKLDENSEQLRKMEDKLKGQQWEIDKELHAHRVTLDHNMTIIKTETDLKIKRSQKMIQMKSHLLNNSTAELRKDQDRLWLEIFTLNESIAKTAELQGPKPCPACNSKAVHQDVGMTKEVLDKLSIALQIHSSNLTNLTCGMCAPSSKQVAAFQHKLEKQEANCAQLVAGLEREMNQKLNETRRGFMEAILGLNVSFTHQRSGQSEHISRLDNKVKELSQLLYGMPEDEQLCDCQKLLVDYSLVLDNLRNASDFMDKMHFDLTYVKQQELELSNNFNDSVQDLFMALQQIRQQFQDFQYLLDEKHSILTEDIFKLQKDSSMIMEDIGNLKKFDGIMDSRMKYLNSSFNSLLEDALRHTVILESLLEQDILEITSDGATKPQLLSMNTLYQVLNETENELADQKMILESINFKLQLLEGTRDLTGAEEAESSSEIDDTDGRKLMELEHEAMEEKQNGLQSNTSKISFREKDIEMLNLRLITLESQCNSMDNYYNRSLGQMKERFTKSVEALEFDVSSLKQFLDGHVTEFHRFTGHTDRVSNGTSRTGRGGLGLKRMRKHQREGHHTNKHLGDYRNASTLNHDKSTPTVQEFLAAFFVGLSNASESTKILKFDQILLNYGDCYSQEKGHFKAPLKGVYMFVVTVEFGQGPGLGFLLVDGKLQRSIHKQQQQQQQQHGSWVWSYTLVELHKGQHVWVEVTQGLVIQRTPPETTFGGFLLFKT